MAGNDYEVLEQKRLNRLLQENLKPAERAEIQKQIEELEPKPERERKTIRPKRLSRSVLGTIDRPAPTPDPPTQVEQIPTPASGFAASPATEPESAAPSPVADTQSELVIERPSEAEIKKMADDVRQIADRVVWLRSFWATNLSVEVDREAEAWLARLQSLAGKLRSFAPEVLQEAIGTNGYLLDQPVRDLRKPTIDQKTQERILPPSAPNSLNASIISDLYWAIHWPSTPRAPEHPPGYVPDGLQSLVG